jgi:hypothetical protein
MRRRVNKRNHGIAGLEGSRATTASRGRRRRLVQGKPDTYRSFAEGFDTPDLKEAETLLDQLSN